MIDRRTMLALPLAAAACSRPEPRYYAFVANQEGQAIAAVELGIVMAVVRHIPLDAAPAQVVAANYRPSVYALTPESGSVHEIQSDNLRFARKVTVASQAVSMQATADDKFLYVLARDPRLVVAVALDQFRAQWKLPLPEEPVTLALAPDGKTAAVTSSASVRLIDLTSRTLSQPLGLGEFGSIAFLDDSKTLIAADLKERRLSLYDVASRRLITHLPVSVRPDRFCFNHDGGQLFVTGEGMDAVVVVWPFYTPRVGGTVLAGHAPGAMGTSDSLLFVASPQSGNVSVLNIDTRKLIAVVQVGADPGFVVVTPDDQYALILNRQSGDLAVLNVPKIQQKANRYSPAGLTTVIPVGSRPVSAVVRSI